MFERITSDPDILGGKPVIKGTRISVEMVLEWLGSGASREEIVVRHPHLSPEDIEEATAFAASSFRNDVFLTATPSPSSSWPVAPETPSPSESGT